MYLRLQLADKEWNTGPYFQFADGTAYLDLTPDAAAGARTITKQLAKPLSHYIDNLTGLNGDPYNTPVRLAFSLRPVLIGSAQVPVAIESDSEGWSTNLTLARSGYWYRVNQTVGGDLHMLGGEHDLQIHLRIRGQ